MRAVAYHVGQYRRFVTRSRPCNTGMILPHGGRLTAVVAGEQLQRKREFVLDRDRPVAGAAEVSYLRW